MKTIKLMLLIMIMALLVLPVQAGLKVKVKAQKANVRNAADASSPVVRQVSAGMVLAVIEKSGVWYKVQLPAAAGNPAQKGYIHGTVVTEVAADVSVSGKSVRETDEPASSTRPLQIKKIKPQPAAKPVKAHSSRNEKFKKLSLRASYLMGFSTETVNSTYTPTIYQEQANFVTKYEARKGNTIDAALGYKFSRTIGVELGASMASRDVAATMDVAVPHPLLFGHARQVSANEGYKLKETDLYLNLMYTLEMNSLAIDIFAGPCYVMSETTLVTGYAWTDTYPYSQVSVTYSAEVKKKNAFGFDGGIAVGYYFGNTFGLVLSGRYIVAKGKFETGNEIPGIEYKLGGLQAGVGLKIKF